MALSVANHATDGNGVESWDATSVYNGPTATVLRVLAPDSPAAVPHRYLYVLPVKPDANTDFGDGLEELRLEGAHNDYNCTLIAFSTHLEPWIADHLTNPDYRYESFVLLDLIPWVEANYGTPGDPVWLLSFSKGGLSALTLILRNPTVFDAAAGWDIPVVSGAGGDVATTAYGTQDNYDDNYDVLPNLVAWSSPFLSTPRLWFSGDLVTHSSVKTYREETEDLMRSLATLGCKFHSAGGNIRTHRWDTGWVPEAIAGLASLSAYAPAPRYLLDAQSALSTQLHFLGLFHAEDGVGVPQYGDTLLGQAPLLGTQTRIAGPTRGAINFTPGSGLDFESHFPALDGAVDKSVVVWVRPDVVNAYQTIIDKEFDLGGGSDGGWALLLTDTGRMYWYADGGTSLIDDGAATLSAGVWVMLAAVWDSTAKSVIFYVNGTANSTKSSGAITESASGSAWLVLGKARNQTLFEFDGALEQVRVYARQLTAPEVAALYTDPTLGFLAVSRGAPGHGSLEGGHGSLTGGFA